MTDVENIKPDTQIDADGVAINILAVMGNIILSHAYWRGMFLQPYQRHTQIFDFLRRQNKLEEKKNHGRYPKFN